jgi:hypothetical protein
MTQLPVDEDTQLPVRGRLGSCKVTLLLLLARPRRLLRLG